MNNIIQIAIARARRNRARMNRLWGWVITRPPKQKDAYLRLLEAVFEKDDPPTTSGRN
ncbi:hypothetical protein BMS3Bbin13_00083 [bacterium BMS3Bbin13]|nr:hypothetical protein BMS3Bbin13_00083 [bacterium BMS3Bbin13]